MASPASRLFGVLLLLALVPPVHAEVQVLFRSGDTDAAGFPLAGFDRPAPTTAGGVAVRGRTSALLVRTGSDITQLARTGDPLPAPLQGTFNRFGASAVNAAGAIAFRATVNSRDGGDGLFYFDGFTIVPVVLAAGTTGDALGSFDLTDAGQVAFVRDDELFLWDAATAVTTTLVDRGDTAPGGGVFRRLGRIAASPAADVIAFQATRRNAPDGLFLIGRTRPAAFVAARRFGNGGLAVSALGHIGFTSDGRASAEAVLRFDPATGTTVTLATAGDVVDGTPIDSIDTECLAIDATGRVVFEAVLDAPKNPRRLIVSDGATRTPASGEMARAATDFATRLTANGHLVWVQDRRLARLEGLGGAVRMDVTPTHLTPLGIGIAVETPRLNDAGVAAFAATRESLEVIRDGVATPVAAVGQELPDGGTLTAIGTHSAVGDTIVFLGASDGVDVSLFAVRGGRIEPLLQVGDPSPLGGLFAQLGDEFDVTDSDVLAGALLTNAKATQGLFRVSLATGKVGPIATAATKGRMRLRALVRPVAAAGGVAFDAEQLRPKNKPGREGIFHVRRRRPKPLVREGQRVRALDAAVSTLRAYAGTDAGVLAAVEIEGGTASSALLLARHGRVTALVRDTEPAPGGGAFASVGTAVVAGRGPIGAFLVPLFGAAGPRGVFTVQDGTVALRLVDGTLLPDGSVLSLADTDTLALDGTTVLLAGRLLGAVDVARALVAVR